MYSNVLHIDTCEAQENLTYVKKTYILPEFIYFKIWIFAVICSSAPRYTFPKGIKQKSFECGIKAIFIINSHWQELKTKTKTNKKQKQNKNNCVSIWHYENVHNL